MSRCAVNDTSNNLPYMFCSRQIIELEVVRAMRRSLPIDSTQAIRKRTRAGMGHCQGKPVHVSVHSLLNVAML